MKKSIRRLVRISIFTLLAIALIGSANIVRAANNFSCKNTSCDSAAYGHSNANTDQEQSCLYENVDVIKLSNAIEYANNYNGREIKVGVLDTGIDGAHEAFSGRLYESNPHNLSTTLHRNFLTNSDYPDEVPQLIPTPADDRPYFVPNPHGTQVAGVIASSTNTKIKLISLQISDRNILQGAVINAIRFATAKGIDVLNLSAFFNHSALKPVLQFQDGSQKILLCNCGHDECLGEQYYECMYDAIEKYPGLLITSSNNFAYDIDYNPDNYNKHLYPASWADPHHPDHLDNIITVGATTVSEDENIALRPDPGWSVSAPGSNFGLRAVHLFAPGTMICTSNYNETQSNTYTSVSGTSFAAPFVTAAVAMTMSLYPQMNSSMVKEKILNSVDELPQLSGYCSTGGRLNMLKSLSSSVQTITFNKEGGVGGTSSANVFTGLSMPAATAPTKATYLFAGYYSAPDGGGTQYYDKNMKSMRIYNNSENITLYARWYASYNIVLDPNSGNGGTASVTAIYSLPMPEATAPEKYAYEFAGYYSADGKQYYDANMSSVRTYDVENSTTLYAKWTLPISQDYLNNLPVYYPDFTFIHETMSSAKLFILLPNASGYYSFFSSTQSGVHLHIHKVTSVDVEWMGYFYGSSWFAETFYLEAWIPYFIVIDSDVYGGIFVFTSN